MDKIWECRPTTHSHMCPVWPTRLIWGHLFVGYVLIYCQHLKVGKICCGMLGFSFLKNRTIHSFQPVFIDHLLCARCYFVSGSWDKTTTKQVREGPCHVEAFVLNGFHEPACFRWHKYCETIQQSDARGSGGLVRAFGEVTLGLRS